MRVYRIIVTDDEGTVCETWEVEYNPENMTQVEVARKVIDFLAERFRWGIE